MKIGDKVKVYDRYRFAIPQTGIIQKFSDANDGVMLNLIRPINSPKYDESSEIWVHKWQLRKLKL